MFEFKSPYSSIPDDYKISYQYIPQVKTGLCSIPIADKAIFISNVYRICNLNQLSFNKEYNTAFHNKDEKKKNLVIDKPIAIGIIGFYQTNDSYTELMESIYGDKSTNINEHLIEEKLLVNGHSTEEKLLVNEHLRNYDPMDNQILMQNTVDIGNKSYKYINRLFELYDKQLIKVRYFKPIIDYNKVNDIPLINVQEYIIPNLNLEAEVSKCKSLIDVFYATCHENDNRPIGILPWKLFKSVMIVEDRDDSYVDKFKDKANELLKIVDDINSYTTDEERKNKYYQYYPEDKPIHAIEINECVDLIKMLEEENYVN